MANSATWCRHLLPAPQQALTVRMPRPCRRAGAGSGAHLAPALLPALGARCHALSPRSKREGELAGLDRLLASSPAAAFKEPQSAGVPGTSGGFNPSPDPK